MINKYTLCFSDKNIEEQYQEHITMTNRNPLLLKIFFISLLINMMDFIQSIIIAQFDWVTPDLLLQFYLPYFVLQAVFLIVYFCKPKYARWALLIQNHLFAYSYFGQEFTSLEQYKYYVFSIVGTQFIIFMTGEFIDVVYQILAFSGVYLAKLILEDADYPYSLVASGILSEFVFIIGFYINQKHLKQQFQMRFVQSQWEQIFLSLITGKYLIFDYDDETQSFQFRNNNQFVGEIENTKQLRKFLRKTSSEDVKLYNLEKFLYEKLQKYKDQKNIIKQQITVIMEDGNKYTFLYSIFYGIRPIVVLQEDIEINRRFGQKQEIEIEQPYTNKYRLFIKMAYRLILKNKKYIYNNLNFMKFKRYCLYSNLQEYLVLKNHLQKEVQLSTIMIQRLLIKIKHVYPDKQISIRNISTKENILNNWQLLTMIFIGIIEKMLSKNLEIVLEDNGEGNISFTFKAYFNERSFQYIQSQIEKYPKQIYSITFKESCIIYVKFSYYFNYCNSRIRREKTIPKIIQRMCNIKIMKINYNIN